MDLQNLTIKKFHEGLMEKEFSAVEVAEYYFKNIAEQDKKIGAYLSLFKKNSLEQAKKVDEEIAYGKNPDVLTGVPIAIKDNILIEGEKATAASKILENYTASYDAGVIKKLKNSNAVFLGKTNMDEFAMGSSTENSAFQLTHNPCDLERAPGGSSGGSAAAVAADLALAALGSDTGGSIRQPAAFCGVVGLKPTYGAVSRSGLIAMASSLDQIGPITKTVEDARILFDAIKGKDELDSTSVNYETIAPQHNLSEIKKSVIGIPKEYFVGGLSDEVKKGMEEAITKLKDLGFKFKEISLPHTKYALSCYYIIMPAEVSTNLARFDGMRYARVMSMEYGVWSLRDVYFKNRGVGFGKEARRRILLGTSVLSAGYYDAYYAKAQKVRRLIAEDFEKAFSSSGDGVDVIFAPTTPTTAFKIGEKTADPLQMYLSDIFTIPANLAGLPAISIPVSKQQATNDKRQMTSDSEPLRYGSSKRQKELPVGFQLIGKHWHENVILGMGEIYENLES